LHLASPVARHGPLLATAVIAQIRAAAAVAAKIPSIIKQTLPNLA
jgi:hypothetical protein